MKIVTILGARPQFIKAVSVSREIAQYSNLEEVIVHTGQHFDSNMSDIFLKEFGFKEPAYFLDVNGLNHGAMTGRMMEKIENVLIKERPDIVLVYGDTNTTLAGALAAKKLHIRIAHIEAGLRSFNMNMPEEVNRVVTDRISDILFCPTDTAVYNLKKEGFDNFKCRVVKSGDVMKDIACVYGNLARKPIESIPSEYILATVHRAENTDNIQNLEEIVNGLNKIANEISILLPIHPRTKNIIRKNNLKINFTLIDAVGYPEIVYLLKNCTLVITDSGGLQKEAFFFNKPCVVLRNETEWLELLEYGYNVLAGSNREKIYKSYKDMRNKNFDFNIDLYGNGKASKTIVEELMK